MEKSIQYRNLYNIFNILSIKLKYINQNSGITIFSELHKEIKIFNKFLIHRKKIRHSSYKMSKYLNVKEIISSDKFGNKFKLKVGDKVIHKTENENFNITEIVDFGNLNGKYGNGKEFLPIILIDKKPHISFGIIVPYDEELENILKILNKNEQLNFLSRDHYKVECSDQFLINCNSSIMQYYRNTITAEYKHSV